MATPPMNIHSSLNGESNNSTSSSPIRGSSPNTRSSFEFGDRRGTLNKSTYIKTLFSELKDPKLQKSNSVSNLKRPHIGSPSIFSLHSSGGLDDSFDELKGPDSPKSILKHRESQNDLTRSTGSLVFHNSIIGKSVGGSSTDLMQSKLSLKESGGGQSASVAANSTPTIDRSTWTIRALKDNPEIVDIMDRVKPLNRGITLAQTYASEDTLLKDDPLIGQDTMMQLILQHLQFEGLLSSRKVLEEEAKVKYNDYPFSESRLMTLIRAALKDSEMIYSLTLDESKDSLTQLEEHLAFMGLLRDDTIETTEDVNIYDEPEDTSAIYVEEKEATANGSSPLTQSGTISPTINKIDESKLIKAASLNKLVILLTPEKSHDLEFSKTFLLTYQSFATPEKLFHKLVQRYHVPIDKLQRMGLNEAQIKSQVSVIQIRVVNTMKTWIKEYFSDFNDKLIQLVKSFCETLKHDNNKSLADRISETLNNKIKNVDEDDEEKKKAVFTVSAPEPKVTKNIWSQNLDIFDIDEEEIARQLTLLDFEIFSAIKATELLNQSWNKPKLRHRSPNVLALINRFNEISQWTASAILSYSRVRDRTRIMAKFVKIAEYSLKPLNNFNVSMAILSGLNAASVHRLKFTKEDMPRHTQQILQDLQTQLSNAFSYREYRNQLAKANPPCIPYLGVHLTDLTFLEEGNSDNIQGLINFSKRRLVYQTISIVHRLQNSKYNLQPVYQIAKLLRVLKPRMDEDELYHRSMKFEPRNKERNEIL